MTDEPQQPEAPTTPSQEPGERMELPKWNRARVKRKAAGGADAPDAFQGGVRKAGRTAVRRAPLLIAVVLLVGGGLGGWIWWSRARVETAAQSTRLLSEAVAIESRGRVGDAAIVFGTDRDRPPPVPMAKTQEDLDAMGDKALKALQEQAPETPAGTLGKLVVAREALERGDAAAAETAYAAFAEDATEGHALRFLAQEGVAFALEARGQHESALAAFRELAPAKGDFYRDMSLWHQGRVLEALGRKDEAIAVYRQYVDEYPLARPSLAQEQVKARLTELDPKAVQVLPTAPSAAPATAPAVAPPATPEVADEKTP